jgi:hypothetical protein
MSPKVTGSTKPPSGGSKGGAGVRGRDDKPKRGRGGGKSRGRAKGQVAYKDTTDPEMVTGPVLDLADTALKEAWMVNTDHRMALIFDAVNPAREFKRDRICDKYSNDRFPEYDPTPESDSDVTDRDEEGNLQQYNPIFHR